MKYLITGVLTASAFLLTCFLGAGEACEVFDLDVRLPRFIHAVVDSDEDALHSRDSRSGLRVAVGSLTPSLSLAAPGCRDQDDMCVGIHPTEPSRSLVISSDKLANKLFVYDLAGTVVQTLNVRHPGNIDYRSGFPLKGEKIDIVAVNLRDERLLAVYRLNHETRKLTRIDNGKIQTGKNYGCCLSVSKKTGKYYAVITSISGAISQWELSDDGAGKVQGTNVRTWKVHGISESAVSDDANGRLYIGEERAGVWELGVEPSDAAPGEKVIKVGEHGLKGDVEGLAIFASTKENGYLIVSDQGKDTFRVYQRAGRHDYLGAFTITGARDTDGIAVASADLGPQYPAGLFLCHTAAHSPCPVLLTPWAAIAKSFTPPLALPKAN